MTKDEWYKQLFERLDNSEFRSNFHLKQKDIDYINEKGLDTIRQHAKEFIAKREAPAYIASCNDIGTDPQCFKYYNGVFNKTQEMGERRIIH